jgi:hypothetical protein
MPAISPMAADDRVDALAVLDEIPGHGGDLLGHHAPQRFLGLRPHLQGGDQDLLVPQQRDLRLGGRGATFRIRSALNTSRRIVRQLAPASV